MKTDIRELDADITAELLVLRKALAPVDDSDEDVALCSVETFIAVALRVFSKTNPSKLRSEARNVEIQARMDGVPVRRVAA